MTEFATAYFIAVGLFVGTIWVLIYVDLIGPGINRVARTVGRAIVRMFHPRRDPS